MAEQTETKPETYCVKDRAARRLLAAIGCGDTTDWPDARLNKMLNRLLVIADEMDVPAGADLVLYREVSRALTAGKTVQVESDAAPTAGLRT